MAKNGKTILKGLNTCHDTSSGNIIRNYGSMYAQLVNENAQVDNTWRLINGCLLQQQITDVNKWFKD